MGAPAVEYDTGKDVELRREDEIECGGDMSRDTYAAEEWWIGAVEVTWLTVALLEQGFALR
jgi:hypothetical protein